MAVRTPSYGVIDLRNVESGQPILAAEVDQALDNCEKYKDSKLLVLTQFFDTLTETSTSTYEQQRRWYIVGRDECSAAYDDGSEIAGNVAVHVRSSGGGVDVLMSIDVFDAADNPIDSAVFTVSGSTSWAWSSWQSLNFQTNGSEGYLLISMKAGASGSVYLAGVAFDM